MCHKPSVHLIGFMIICLLPLCSAQATCPDDDPEMGISDRVTFLVGGICGGFLSFFLILGYLIFPPLRRQPGDLIFALSCSDFTVCLFWFISAVRDSVDGTSFYCIFSAALSTFAGAITVTYNFSFCYYLISVLKHSLKHANIPKKSLHIIPVTLSLIFVLYVYFTHQFGLTGYGTCSISTKGKSFQTWIGVVVILAYVILSVITQRYVKAFAPDCERINSVKKDFLLLYTGLLTATSIMWTVIFVTMFLITLHQVGKIPACWIPRWIIPLSNTARIASPFVLSTFRYRDKFVGKYMGKLFFCFNRDLYRSPLRVPLKDSTKDTSRSGNHSVVSLEMSDFGRNDTIPDENNIHSEKSSIRRDLTFNDDDSQGIAMLAKSLRFQIIYTILCGVVYSEKKLKEKNLPKIEIVEEEQSFVKNGKVHSVKRRNSDIYKNFARYELNNRVIQNELPEYYTKMQSKKFDVLQGNLNFYCENIFSELRQQDQNFLDVQESLDIDANEEKVHKAGEGRGGKSGEFFFFSYDNKLIIKTMTSEELGVLLGILERYHKHNIYDNPMSLIAKIYGVFSFQRDNSPDPVHLIMMRNVNGWPGSCVVRKYDLKGSTFARQVDKRKNASKESLDPDETYKDIDFLKYDQKFFIKEELKPKILEVIKKDVQFLRGCGIIDYSLAVYLVDKSKERKKSRNLTDDSSSRNSEIPINGISQLRERSKKPKAEEFNEFYSMQSQEEPHLWYNMGIIDYLQLYTFQKMTEKYCKRIMNCNTKLDTSSKSSQKYSVRFLEFAEKVFS